MSKRRHGEGCWDSISVNGITYKRFRIDGQSFTGKTEKACKAKYLKWKNGQKTNLTDKKTTVKQVALEWLDSKKKHIKSSTYDGYEYFVTDILGKNNDASSDLGSAQILNVTNKQIQQYVDGWADLTRHYSSPSQMPFIKVNIFSIPMCLFTCSSPCWMSFLMKTLQKSLQKNGL